jgi:hypothetical protein
MVIFKSKMVPKSFNCLEKDGNEEKLHSSIYLLGGKRDVSMR